MNQPQKLNRTLTSTSKISMIAIDNSIGAGLFLSVPLNQNGMQSFFRFILLMRLSTCQS